MLTFALFMDHRHEEYARLAVVDIFPKNLGVSTQLIKIILKIYVT